MKFATGIAVLVLVFWAAFRLLDSEPASKEEFEPEVGEARADTLINAIALGDSIVAYAQGLLGTPYTEAGCSRDGFDCSGFVFYVFRHFDIEVPRTSSGFADFGKEVPIDSVRKGDVLVFRSPTRNTVGHVGIVTAPKGRESDFIHASSGSKMQVIITSLKKESYARRFVKAVRVM